MNFTAARRERGFTLIEILIVVVILGILAVAVVPQFGEATGDARERAFVANLRDVTQIAQAYYNEHGRLPPSNGPTQPLPPELFESAGRDPADYPTRTPLGGYWHVGKINDRYGIGIWWDISDDADADVKRDCLAVDEGIDDGTDSGGRFVCDDGTQRYYWLVE